MNGYLLVIAALVVTGGRLGDIYGRRAVFTIGLAIFAGRLGALGGGVERGGDDRRQGGPGDRRGGDAAALAGDRQRRLPGEKQARALGIWAAISALALAIGPLVGGLLVDVDWRLIFWINVPVLAIGVAVMLGVVPETRDESATHRLDLAGLVLLAAGLIALVLPLGRVDRMGARVGAHPRRAGAGRGADGGLLGGRAPGRPADRRVRAVSQRPLLRRQRRRVRAGRRLVEPDLLSAPVPRGPSRALGDRHRPADPPGDGADDRHLAARGEVDRPLRGSRPDDRGNALRARRRSSS